MTPKLKLKMMIDLLATILLPILMAHMITGQKVHEWVGALMLVLLIVHNVLNVNWYRGLFRGRYNLKRTMQTIINLMVFTSMLGLMVSGIIMSRHVFSFLPIYRGMAVARKLHMLSAYWGFILMSLHLGMHFSMMMGISKRLFRVQSLFPRQYKVALRMTAILIATYGIYAFSKNDIASYVLMRNEFVFFNPDQSAVQYFVEYLAIMGLFTFIAHYYSKILQRCTRE